jgi:DNA-binding LacI/PurR family transcriptional regulator
MGGAIGIKAVAAAAGVSTTTVSHALNGKGRISDQTRDHVREVAARLGYQPSAMARGLAGGRTGMLAMVVSGPEGFGVQVGDFDYFLQLMNGATSSALRRGFSLTMLQADDPEVLDGLRLDGAIVIDPIAGDPLVERLSMREVPVVTTGRVIDGPPDACWVDNDHVEGTREVLDHLAEAGARRVALLTPPPVSSYAFDAHSAYLAWCEERGQEPMTAQASGSMSEGSGYAVAMRLLQSDHPPDAIYATLDRLALGALLAAEARGIDVPGSLRIAGCTDSDASRQARPALTALSLDPDRLGREAVDLLLALVEDGEPPARHRIVPSTVVPRASTAPARRRAAPVPGVALRGT